MPSSVSKPRILVVEDEVIVSRDIAVQLAELGYEPVGQATRGDEAIALTGQLQPDLVLMDIQLAGSTDGIMAAQAIREQFDRPVVFLTAFAADDVLERAKLAEPFGYILKPFSERELRSVVEMALYKHQAERKLHLSQQAQRESALHTQSILDNMADGVITINAQGVIESFSKAASAIFGYSQDEAIGRNVSMLMPEPHQSRHDGYIQRYLTTGVAQIIGTPREVEGLRRDGSVFPLGLSLSKTTRLGETTFIGLVRDFTQHHLDVEEIRRLAFYDPLTGLPNRRLLMDRLNQAMLTTVRSAQHGALIFLDLDHFKRINDSQGHNLGDLLLQQVAARLSACVREGDSVVRLGGDEFVVLLEALSTHAHEAATHAEAIANKILYSLGQPYILQGNTFVSTPSIGIVMFMQDDGSIDDLIKRADAAMYQAKAAGRNTIRFFDSALQEAVAAHTELASDMQRALDKLEFVLHYQIQVQVAVGGLGEAATMGVEALVRWASPTRGLVSPAQFIPLAEETGLILPLGQWVLETACAQLVRWALVPETAHWTMAVNVSALQFAQADFVDQVDQALQKTGARADLLKLELTESMLLTNVDAIIFKMNALKARGVSFSLDDFGTGYSSLSYLKRLPLAQLKIDQSFVRDILSDPHDAAIASTIVALGNSLGLKVIAEGVETEAQRDFLASVGCHTYQGYYFGRPGPAGVAALGQAAQQSLPA